MVAEQGMPSLLFSMILMQKTHLSRCMLPSTSASSKYRHWSLTQHVRQTSLGLYTRQRLLCTFFQFDPFPKTVGDHFIALGTILDDAHEEQTVRIRSSSANLRNKFKYSATKKGARMKNISMFNYFTTNSLEIYGSSTVPHCASLYTWLLQKVKFYRVTCKEGPWFRTQHKRPRGILHLLFR